MLALKVLAGAALLACLFWGVGMLADFVISAGCAAACETPLEE